MKKTFACAALAAAVLGLGTVAMADDAMMAKPMAMAPMTDMATMLCRPVTGSEKSNAMTGTKLALVCKPVDMKAVMSMKKSVEAMPNGESEWQKMLNGYRIGPET